MHMPFIRVTALDQTCDKVQGFEAGADDFTPNRWTTSPSSPASRIWPPQNTEQCAGACRRRASRSHDHRLELAVANGLRLCSQVRSLERTHLPITVIVQPGEVGRLLRALDKGGNDCVTRPVDCNELLTPCTHADQAQGHSYYLRHRLEASVELAVTDALTGLYNRRNERHLAALAEHARTPEPVALAAVDRHRQFQVRSTAPGVTTAATASIAKEALFNRADKGALCRHARRAQQGGDAARGVAAPHSTN
jgi:PleD family two-component response regulator